MKRLLIALALSWPVQGTPGKTLLDYTNELHLTSEQSAQLKTDVLFFVQHSEELRRQMQAAERLVSQQIEHHAPLEQLQQSVSRAEDLRTQLRLQDVTTSRKLRRLLTPEQWVQWQQIKQKNSGGKSQ